MLEKYKINFHIAKIFRLKRRIMDAEMKKLDICRSKWQTLIWLKTLGACSQQELLKHLDIDAAHLARVLEAFDREQWIIRTRSSEDRRAVLIDITEKCRSDIMPAIEHGLQKEVDIMLDSLSTTEKTTLNRLLTKIETNLLTAVQKENSDE
jgi:DNA-binding MarR family transcriptional regulator